MFADYRYRLLDGVVSFVRPATRICVPQKSMTQQEYNKAPRVHIALLEPDYYMMRVRWRQTSGIRSLNLFLKTL